MLNPISINLIDGVPMIIHYGKVCVHLALQEYIVKWFHEYFSYSG